MDRPIRLVGRTGVAAALVAAVILLVASPATAGGPTSVLLVGYDGSRAAGALTGSRAYTDLEKALDAYNTPSGPTTTPDAFMEAPIRLTWMIHDVTPWRLDAIRLEADGVWVDTSMTLANGGDPFGAPSVRHRPADPDLLLATLTRLGILGSRGAGTTPVPAVPVDRTPAGVPADAADTADGSAAVTQAPWWSTPWALLGSLGLGVVAGARPWSRRPRRAEHAASAATEAPSPSRRG